MHVTVWMLFYGDRIDSAHVFGQKPDLAIEHIKATYGVREIRVIQNDTIVRFDWRDEDDKWRRSDYNVRCVRIY